LRSARRANPALLRPLAKDRLDEMLPIIWNATVAFQRAALKPNGAGEFTGLRA
jgi:hypothetical protein